MMMMRVVFAADLTVTLLLFGQYIGVYFGSYSNGQRIVLCGFFGLTTYLLASQWKAKEFNIPFDAYSWSGLVVVTIINAGLFIALVERRPWKRE